MARFPYHEENVKALGRLLAEAAVNPVIRKRLENNPAAELKRIGLPEQTTALFDFKIVQENSEKPYAVLPYRLNETKLNRGEPDYLASIADTVIARSVN